MPESACTLFVDTNSLLHYPPLKETDWGKVAGCSEVRTTRRRAMRTTRKQWEAGESHEDYK
jgi:hypothetical protein